MYSCKNAIYTDAKVVQTTPIFMIQDDWMNEQNLKVSFRENITINSIQRKCRKNR